METNVNNTTEPQHDAKLPVMHWVTVSEKLPEIGYKNQVLIYGKREYEDKMEVLQAWREIYGFCSLFMREDENLYVTHWMDLPKPPCA